MLRYKLRVLSSIAFIGFTALYYYSSYTNVIIN